ncbi:MAG: Holliday junction branch migration protein RuvA [Weeksellaceae bacterium]|nr:Holliday junction branch migration protein RuvA [Weeksellaceae bacterium]
MITHLQGKLVEINPSFLVVDCGGVGYKVHISLQTYAKTQHAENLLIYTYHLVREDAQILYGFADKQERIIFEKLISVNGVGPASAQMMLSTLSAEEIFSAVSHSDVKMLQSVKGIGLKTAQRIIIDLKDKISKIEDTEILSKSSENKNKFEALSALEVLGISKKASENMVDKLIKDHPGISLEELIKETLKKS